MTPEASLSTDELNIQMMRVHLREFGTAARIREEAVLIEQIKEVNARISPAGRDELDVLQVAAEVLLRVPYGQVYNLSVPLLRYLSGALRRLDKGVGFPEGFDPDGGGIAPLDRLLAHDIARDFRKGLSDKEKPLFEAWVENAGRHGWQREYARAKGVTDKAISTGLKELRERLKQQHGVQDPDLFAEALRDLPAQID